MKHPLPSAFVDDPVRIALVGCGGNGSQMLTGLARMHIALRSLGHPGFEVTCFDPDRVSEANIGRQLFSHADVGHYKASLLIHRLNIFFGLDWNARTVAFPDERRRDLYSRDYQIVVGCVDSAKSRRAIYRYGLSPMDSYRFAEIPARFPYWLDVGNLNNTGQVVLGQFAPVFDPQAEAPDTLVHVLSGKKSAKSAKSENRRQGSKFWKEWSVAPLHLPNITDLFPSILDASVPEVDIPSCSLAQALESQDLFVNQAVTTFALQLLWMFFRQAGLDHHGYFVNLATGSVRTLPIDRAVWRRFNPAICGE